MEVDSKPNGEGSQALCQNFAHFLIQPRSENINRATGKVFALHH